MDIYVARQPIFDADYKVVAYELLYRDSAENRFNAHLSDNVATSLLLMNSYFNFGLDNLVGDTKAFINFDKHLVEMGVPELLNNERVYVEILETVVPDKKLLKRLQHLKELGYTLVLDDYCSNYPHEDVLDLVKIIKVDFAKCDDDCRRDVVERIKGTDKILLAEKVETKEEFELAKSLGYTYFQGFYFARPSVETRKTMNSSGLQYVRLMSELNNPEPDFHVLSDIILQDVALTYKLLKLVNANAKPISEITSVQQALAVLGIDHFRTWLSLAMVQNMSSKESSEAVKYALIRSNLLSKIARHSSMKKEENLLSLLGTLSVLDVILEMNMADALENLPIGEEMKLTLLGHETRYSDAMKLCLAYEKGVFDEAEIAAKRLNYELTMLPEDYVSAISWAERMFIELS
ncbi:HDOD domain-containing protein [Acidaminobacter sp. JC074]|uniref:EAL and HDOD domain-containing protein n=1 Tax=Acidaminobacter sp. JC074 TaxID=2530199 RepID=UPI001F10566C|nr:HDOD domain-containing protein [Acidaminobacter sp. JC074]MCH4887134.1 HDOD domain-containing protein [Acidaminobacter sp. JC074]